MADDRTRERPVRRAYHVYLYAVCLATVIVLLFSTASALFGVVRIAAPGTTSRAGTVFGFGGPFFGDDGVTVDADAERDAGLVQLIESGILALVAGGLFALHWTRAERLRRRMEAETRTPARPSEGRGEAERPPTRRRRTGRPPGRPPDET